MLYNLKFYLYTAILGPY